MLESDNKTMPVKGTDGRDVIKGYKLDHDKLAKRFGRRRDDPDNTRFMPIVRKFPRGSYKYIGVGEEQDGHLSLVVVLEDGYDKERLEEMAMPSFDQRGASEILTAGVWPSS
jgi:hypothetical protein